MKKLFLLLAAIVTLALGASAQTRTIQGTVLSSADSEPLLGATVMPIGGGQGVSTNADGHFTLKVPASVKEIRVSYIGMTPQTVAVSDNMKIVLEEASNVLDQVVVTGYGSGKKLGSVVGAVSVVDEKVINETPASNFIDALQGQVSGLAINSNSGDPSSDSNSIILRGRNSLSQSVTPLFICDGAPINEAFFTSMNPQDIESITVLKDASSIAIYGSRGANGIIVITTKKGKYGAKAKATIRANYGWSQMVQDNVTMMNSQQYKQFREIVGQPLNATITNLIDNYGISTNWRNELFDSSAPTYSINGTVSGGSENLSYYLSLGHFSMDGIMQNSEMNRQTLSWSMDAKVNNWFRIGFSGNAGFRRWKKNYSSENFVTDEGLDVSNPTMMARLALPYDTPLGYSFNDNGDLVWGDRTELLRFTGWTLPWWFYEICHWKNTELSGNMRLYEQITPIKGLTIRAQQAMEGSDTRGSVVYDPYKSFETVFGRPVGSAEIGEINPGSNSESFSRYYQFTYTNTAEYKNTFAEKHEMSLLLGQESIIARSEGFGVSTSGTTDMRTTLLDQGNFTDINRVTYSKSEVVINSYFLNGNYGYDGRYYFDFSVRRDGNSRFAPGHKWATFGAFGLMWNLTNESFLKGKTTWLNDLRLHYSYGATGNSNIGNFEWQGKMIQGGNYNGSNSLVLSGSENPKLSWETIYSHDLGVNVRVFDRLTVAVDWYKKRTENMLYAIPFSLTTGVSTQKYNACSMTNNGIEVDVQGDIYKDKDWYVGARVQFNYNKNQITELWDGNSEFVDEGKGLIQKVGDVMSQYYLVRYVGVDPADGKQVWLDKNDNPTKQFPSDAYVCTGKSAFAPWVGGFGLNARWKGLSASVNFAFQSGKYMINNDRYFICNPTEFAAYNQSVDALNMWTTPGQVTNVPAYGEQLHLGEDTSWLEDASFTRLKNLTVAYDFPSKLINKWGLSGLQLHFTGRNLWTITNFSGYDPEVQSNMVQFQYPNTRQYEFGIEVSF